MVLKSQNMYLKAVIDKIFNKKVVLDNMLLYYLINRETHNGDALP